LFTEVHHDRWRRHLFTSSHNMAPVGGWEIRFKETNGSLNESDYDRAHTELGEVSEGALRTWLDFKRRGYGAQDKNEEFASGELPGICAFDTVYSALAYDRDGVDDEDVHFVAFRGRRNGPCTPEAGDGAVVASVEEVLCEPLLRSEFIARFGTD
jgi:hypothetical protein